MPMRPIDLQSVISKVSSVAKSKQALVQQETNALVDAQLERQKKDLHKRETVQALNQGDKLTIDYKREKSPEDKRGKRDRKDRKSNRKSSDEQPHIDIKI